MKKVLKSIAILLLAVIILLLLAFDTRLKCVSYHLDSKKLSGEVKLALITDLHSCLYGENQSDLIAAIDSVGPDAVLFGGDIFDDVYVNENSQILIDNLAQKYQLYYVSGNHEWWSKRAYEYFAYLNHAGVTVLRGDSSSLNLNGDHIVISGIDDLDCRKYDSSYPDSEQQLKQIADAHESSDYHILLAHRPENIRQYLTYDFDLVLSGHAHGGQGRIPFILNGLYAPNQGFFPEFAGGLYDFGDQKFIVSRGLSKENTKLPRIFNRPELVFLTLGSE